MKKYKATFKPIRDNSFDVEAESVVQATQIAFAKRVEMIEPHSVEIVEITDTIPANIVHQGVAGMGGDRNQ